MAFNRLDLSGTSPNAAGTAVIGGPINGLDEYDALIVVCTFQGATGGTLNLFFQGQYDSAGDWVDLAQPFAQIAAATAASTKAFTLSRYQQQTTATAVGTNLTPSIAVSTVLGGEWTDSLRLVAVAGAGTTAGTLQVVKLVGVRVAHGIY